jgi:hypothetical protein
MINPHLWYLTKNQVRADLDRKFKFMIFIDCGEGSASPLRTRTFSTADMDPIQLEGCAGGYFCHPQVPVLTY